MYSVNLVRIEIHFISWLFVQYWGTPQTVVRIWTHGYPFLMFERQEVVGHACKILCGNFRQHKIHY